MDVLALGLRDYARMPMDLNQGVGAFSSAEVVGGHATISSGVTY